MSKKNKLKRNLKTRHTQASYTWVKEAENKVRMAKKNSGL